MKCQKCKSSRVANIYAKAKDLHTVSLGDTEIDGYLPSDIGIGGGSETTFDVCLNCGHVQGKWPLPKTAMELYGTACSPEEDDDEDDDDDDEEYKMPKISWAERKKRAIEKQSEILEIDPQGIVKDFKGNDLNVDEHLIVIADDLQLADVTISKIYTTAVQLSWVGDGTYYGLIPKNKLNCTMLVKCDEFKQLSKTIIDGFDERDGIYPRVVAKQLHIFATKSLNTMLKEIDVNG